jgi:hypothetical protein
MCCDVSADAGELIGCAIDALVRISSAVVDRFVHSWENRFIDDRPRGQKVALTERPNPERASIRLSKGTRSLEITVTTVSPLVRDFHVITPSRPKDKSLIRVLLMESFGLTPAETQIADAELRRGIPGVCCEAAGLIDQ